MLVYRDWQFTGLLRPLDRAIQLPKITFRNLLAAALNQHWKEQSC
jgi:hypothetical protein